MLLSMSALRAKRPSLSSWHLSTGIQGATSAAAKSRDHCQYIPDISPSRSFRSSQPVKNNPRGVTLSFIIIPVVFPQCGVKVRLVIAPRPLTGH